MPRFSLAMIVAALVPFAANSQDASGDAAAGETAFARQCVACHVVVDADGNKLAGRNGRTGPNLYGLTGHPIGSVDGFRYGDAILALHEQGELWTEENFVNYVQDPTNWLREKLDDSSARGKMAFKVRSAEDAANIYAYLVSLDK